MAAKPKYNALYHDDWAWSLAAMGATNDEIAEAMGVSKRTIIRWCKDHESFAEALAKGKGMSDAKVIRSLYERAIGYTYTETKTVTQPVIDEQGKLKGNKILRVESYKKHAPPDTTAQIYWLKNRQRDKWKDKYDDTYAAASEVEEQTQFYLPQKDDDQQ